MATAALRCPIIASVIVGFNALGWAQEVDVGKTEFLSSCAACHGADGKGNGPMSAELKVAPPNLTVLAKKNNGVFPVSAVYEMIDGRHPVAAHGTRDMPIWGLRYIPSSQGRILALVDYLSRIQEKRLR